MSHRNDKYKQKINPGKIAVEIEDIASPIFFKSWIPKIIPDPHEHIEWHNIFESCDGIALAEEFGMNDHAGKIIFMKETTKDDPELNFTVNKAFAELFRARKNRLLEKD